MKEILFVKFKKTIILLALLSIPVCSAQSPADVEWNIYRTLKLDSPPVDVAVSNNGKWIFILTDKGSIVIYSSDGDLEGEVKIGKYVDQVEVGPRENLLLLKSRKNSTIQVLALDFVKRINISGSPSLGAEDAPVTIIVFSDYQCGSCWRQLPLYEEPLDLYPGKVRVVFKNFPLKRHKYAKKAAMAALAAHAEGMFWEFHDLLFENFKQLSDGRILDIADELGLNREEFDRRMKDPAIEKRVEQDVQDGRKAGVRGTPAFFVNGRLLQNKSLKGIRSLIEKELKTPDYPQN